MTAFAYALQEILTSYIQLHSSRIQHVEYFSDGCSEKYKNFKNFLNLAYHK